MESADVSVGVNALLRKGYHDRVKFAVEIVVGGW